jgi:hypothetical protein
VILVLAIALTVAGINVAAGRWLQNVGDGFWQSQFLAFAFRFVTIFGVAGAIWATHHRMPEVVVFIVAGAIAQMVGQICLLMKDRKTNA